MKEQLRLFGLSENEITIYLSLLKLGKASGTVIRQSTCIANSQVYVAIDSLVQQGLITYEKHTRGKRYVAIDPEIIKELTAERYKRVEAAIPLLKQLRNKEKAATETAVYEGFQGFKNALLQLAEETPEERTIHIIGFSNQAYGNEQLAAVLRDVNKQHKEKKHHFRMILDQKDNEFLEARRREGITDVRFMGRGFRSPAAINISDESVYILLWDEQPYAFTIKNRNIAEGFRTYFEFLWNIAKEK